MPSRERLIAKASWWSGWCTDHETEIPELTQLGGFLLDVKLRMALDRPPVIEADHDKVIERAHTEDAFGITHGVTVEQAVGLAASLVQTLNEAVPTIRRLESVIEQKAIEEN